jgi:hypothetical protein
LVAAHELIRQFRGQIHARPKPPGRQEILILIPLAKGVSKADGSITS